MSGMFDHVVFIFKFKKYSKKILQLNKFSRSINPFDLCTLFCLSYVQNHENILSSKPRGTPRKENLFPKTSRNQKLDSSYSPNPEEVKRVGNWKPHWCRLLLCMWNIKYIFHNKELNKHVKFGLIFAIWLSKIENLCKVAKKGKFRKSLDPIWGFLLKKVSQFVIPSFRETL